MFFSALCAAEGWLRERPARPIYAGKPLMTNTAKINKTETGTTSTTHR